MVLFFPLDIFINAFIQQTNIGEVTLYKILCKERRENSGIRQVR